MKSKIRCVIALCVNISLAFAAHAFDIPKPGGLVLGMSRAEIIGSGTTIRELSNKPSGIVIVADSLPEQNPDFLYAELLMGHTDQLAQITIYSKSHQKDNYGFWITERVRLISGYFNSKYGQPDVMISELEPYLHQPDRFAEALERRELTMAIGWRLPNITIFLDTAARDGATGYSVRYTDNDLVDKIKHNSYGRGL